MNSLDLPLEFQPIYFSNADIQCLVMVVREDVWESYLIKSEEQLGKAAIEGVNVHKFSIFYEVYQMWFLFDK